MRSIKSLEKGLEILEVIADSAEGARVKDIAAAMSDPVSNLKLYLDSLLNAGYVRRDATSARYYLSRKIAEVAKRGEHNQHALLRHVALPELERLRNEFDENVLLAVLDGHDLHFITRIQSKRSVQVLHNADVHYPPHVTAAGKAILAFISDEAREKYLDDALYHRFTEKSLVSPNRLRSELELIHREGYAVNYGEYESEIMAVASPILVDSVGVASVVVQFPSFRYQEAALPAFGERIKQSTRRIEQAYVGSVAEAATHDSMSGASVLRP